MGLSELRLFNPGVDVWIPGAGTAVRLPSQVILPAAPRSGVVINVPEMRMYYYPEGESVVHTWPISIGRVGWETPLGKTSIVRKKVGPTWYPPESIREEHALRGDILPRVVRPGPDNPLGSHALYLGFPEYLIHGTNKPYSIGMRVSHGCVRMYPEHIVEVFDLVKPGTPVTLVHQEIKVGWRGDKLYLEVHPNIGVPEEEARPSISEGGRLAHHRDSGDGPTRHPGLATGRRHPRCRERSSCDRGDPAGGRCRRPQRARELILHPGAVEVGRYFIITLSSMRWSFSAFAAALACASLAALMASLAAAAALPAAALAASASIMAPFAAS